MDAVTLGCWLGFYATLALCAALALTTREPEEEADDELEEIWREIGGEG